MVDNDTLRPEAARVTTRVAAAVVQTGPVARAVRAEHALGAATHVRVARVLGQAAARARTPLRAAHRVGPARVGGAGLRRGLRRLG